MRNMFYKKRVKHGLLKSEIASYLDISYLRYSMIERGEVKMPQKFMDKWLNLFDNINTNKLNILQERKDKCNWFDDVVKKDSHGNREIRDYMAKYNITNYKELSKQLGVSVNVVSIGVSKPNKATPDLKCAIYDFFHNELNIQKPKEKNEQKSKRFKIYEQQDKNEPVVLYRRGKSSVNIIKTNINDYLWLRDFDYIGFVNETHMTCFDGAKLFKTSQASCLRFMNALCENRPVSSLALSKIKKVLDDEKYSKYYIKNSVVNPMGMFDRETGDLFDSVKCTLIDTNIPDSYLKTTNEENNTDCVQETEITPNENTNDIVNDNEFNINELSPTIKSDEVDKHVANNVEFIRNTYYDKYVNSVKLLSRLNDDIEQAEKHLKLLREQQHEYNIKHKIYLDIVNELNDYEEMK